MIISGGPIYTSNELTPTAEAVAVADGRIVFVGSMQEAQAFQGEQTKQVDLNGNTLLPGFIESHGHLYNFGYSMVQLDLRPCKSYEEVLEKVANATEKMEPGQWITGRGWHEGKWDSLPSDQHNGFPTHERLSQVSPFHPVMLTRAGGHAGLMNARAFEVAGLTPQNIEEKLLEMEGGNIDRYPDGQFTGIIHDNAKEWMKQHMEKVDSPSEVAGVMRLAIRASQAAGVTSFHDAGITAREYEGYQYLLHQGDLGLRMHAMLYAMDSAFIESWYQRGPIVDTTNYLFSVRAIKLHADGALGNRGAWLLESYTDHPGHFGLETTSMDYVETTAKKALENGFQLCVHAIGDRANREVLDRYENAFQGYDGDASAARFRIEHAQHLTAEDIPRFAELGVIASMQGIHMSSDRPWAIDRLGEERILEGAYVWQKLLQSGARVINGTDVPVEPINPLACFYASVTRKTLQGMPEGGYEADQKMSRQEALRSYTLDAAYGSFEESIKGSIEVGKLADFVILNQDIMTIPEDDILSTRVVQTILGGETVYVNNQ
ncbi:amidohydrolase [bacterium SCSIO 12741]|nr:amidohydrolase [bacterium SCSIO 12741]